MTAYAYEQHTAGGWLRVSKNAPCQVCGKPDWCGISADGAVAVCMRVASMYPAANEGHVHRLRERDEPLPVRRVRTIRVAPAPTDLGHLARQYQAALSLDRLDALALQLGLHADALRAVGVGWISADAVRAMGIEWAKDVFAFPMFAGNTCVGFRVRDPRSGCKWHLTGTKAGLFRVSEQNGTVPPPLFVVEGATDSCAAWQIGLRVVGRPSCTGGTTLVARVAHGLDVVVVADFDSHGAGRRGAEALASALLPTVRTLRVIEPPVGLKDLREWVRRGATRADVLAVVEKTPVRALRTRCINGR